MSFGKELTATQIQNRQRKSRSASRGMIQRHGTPPTAHTVVDEPWLRGLEASPLKLPFRPLTREMLALNMALLAVAVVRPRSKRSDNEKEQGLA